MDLYLRRVYEVPLPPATVETWATDAAAAGEAVVSRPAVGGGGLTVIWLSRTPFYEGQEPFPLTAAEREAFREMCVPPLMSQVLEALVLGRFRPLDSFDHRCWRTAGDQVTVWDSGKYQACAALTEEGQLSLQVAESGTGRRWKYDLSTGEAVEVEA